MACFCGRDYLAKKGTKEEFEAFKIGDIDEGPIIRKKVIAPEEKNGSGQEQSFKKFVPLENVHGSELKINAQ